MDQQQFIQSDKSKFTFNQSDINYLVGTYSPSVIGAYLEKVLYYTYNAENDGSRHTTPLLIRSAIANGLKFNTAFTLNSIGKAVKKNHATIIHYNNNHNLYLTTFPEYFVFFSHCEFIVKEVSKLYVQSKNEYIENSSDNLEYMEKLIREDKTRQRSIDKLQGIINSINITLKKVIPHSEKIKLIEKTLHKKRD